MKVSMFDKEVYEQNKELNAQNIKIGKPKWIIDQIKYKEGIAFANGCSRKKCPCRIWTQCSKYNSKVWEDLHPEQLNKEIHDWYETNFRVQYVYSDIFGNG